MDVPRCGQKGGLPRWVVVGRKSVSSMRRVHLPAVALLLARTPRYCGAAHCSEILTWFWFTSHRQTQTVLAPKGSRTHPAGPSWGSEGCSARAPSTRPQRTVGWWRRAPTTRTVKSPPLASPITPFFGNDVSYVATYKWRRGSRPGLSPSRILCHCRRGVRPPMSLRASRPRQRTLLHRPFLWSAGPRAVSTQRSWRPPPARASRHGTSQRGSATPIKSRRLTERSWHRLQSAALTLSWQSHANTPPRTYGVQPICVTNSVPTFIPP